VWNIGIEKKHHYQTIYFVGQWLIIEKYQEKNNAK